MPLNETFWCPTHPGRALRRCRSGSFRCRSPSLSATEPAGDVERAAGDFDRAVIGDGGVGQRDIAAGLHQPVRRDRESAAGDVGAVQRQGVAARRRSGSRRRWRYRRTRCRSTVVPSSVSATLAPSVTLPWFRWASLIVLEPMMSICRRRCCRRGRGAEIVDDAAIDVTSFSVSVSPPIDLDRRAAGGIVERGAGDRVVVQSQRDVAAQRDIAVVQMGIADRAGAGDVDIAGNDAAARAAEKSLIGAAVDAWRRSASACRRRRSGWSRRRRYRRTRCR